MKKLFAAAALLALAACSDADEAQRVAEIHGLTEVETGGWSMFGCGQEDQFATKFSATTTAGKRVTGVVCSGWFKGSTIRFN